MGMGGDGTGPRMCLRWMFLLGLFTITFSFSVARAQQQTQTTFDNTTLGIEKKENRDLDPDQISIDREYQKAFRQFQDGRKSTTEGGKSNRYGGILENHDLDRDGLSDHANAANDAEGGQDEAAFGRRGMNQKDRQAAMDAFCKKQGKEGPKPGSPTACGEDISAVLVDLKPAHGVDKPGQDKEKHRTYQLTSQSAANADKAGKNYAERVLRDARKFFSGNEKANVAVNPDALRSEAQWLNEQMLNEIDNSWRTLRAHRIFNDDFPYGNSKFKTLGCTFTSSKSSLGALANQFAKQHASVKNLAEKDRLIGVAMADVVYEKCFKDLVDKVNKMPDSGEPQKSEKKAKQAELASYQSELRRVMGTCMVRDVWCSEQPVAGTNPQEKKFDRLPAGRDVGNAFRDTREFNYVKMSGAMRGPVKDYMKNMRSMDFNERNNPQEWARMEKQHQELLKEMAAYQKNLKDAGFKNVDSTSNTNTMSGSDMVNNALRKFGGTTTTQERVSAPRNVAGGPAGPAAPASGPRVTSPIPAANTNAGSTQPALSGKK